MLLQSLQAVDQACGITAQEISVELEMVAHIFALDAQRVERLNRDLFAALLRALKEHFKCAYCLVPAENQACSG